jgi:hypothetical protein
MFNILQNIEERGGEKTKQAKKIERYKVVGAVHWL